MKASPGKSIPEAQPQDALDLLVLKYLLLPVQSHPFFAGVDWDSMYLQRSPYAPVVTHELDTQNFEHFDEEARGMGGSGAKRWARADPNFIGYTYKSHEAVQPSDGALFGLPRCLQGWDSQLSLNMPVDQNSLKPCASCKQTRIMWPCL